MRVRYGKPIKVKSLVGKQLELTADNSFNIYSITSAQIISLCNNKFGYSTVPEASSKFNNENPIQIIEGHKYFVNVKVHNMLDRSTQRWMCMRFTSTTGASYALSDNIFSYLWYFTSNTVSAIITGTTTGNLAYIFFGDFPSDQKMTIATEYPEEYIVIDLTEIGLDNLTAQQFYNKYNKYFPLIATGEEITIDDKAGQVSLGKTLPLNYTEVEYLESNGAQYIDTGYIPNNNTKIEISFLTLNFGNYGLVFGGETSWDSNAFHLYKTSSYFDVGFGTQAPYSSLKIKYDLNTLYNAVLDKNGIIINGVKYDFSIGNIAGTNSVYLFAVHRNNIVTDANAQKRIFNCHIYENNILVRDLVPCYRNSDKKPGLYDKVTGTFYTNAGTGEFVLGPVVGLPSEYQRVEYIQSSGTQYINTDVLPSANITFDFSIKQTTDMKSKVFGSRGTSYTDKALAVYFNGSNIFQLNYGDSLWSATDSLDNTIVNVKTEKVSSNYNWYVNDVKVWNPSIYTGEYFNGNIFFGSYNSNGNPAVSGSSGTQTLYYCKIFDNNSLIRNFIPYYNKYTNDIGLYDLCNSGKNLCFRTSLSHYSYSKDYLRYNASKAIYLERGTYTYTCSNQASAGAYLQVFSPTDTSTNVTITTAISYKSKGSTAWNDRTIHLDSGFGSLTFTLTDNYIITICSKANDADIENPQIEKGTTATTYEHSAFYINQGTGTFLKGNDVNNTISCKIAGGSSDIYYGYNQLVDNGYFDSVTGWDNFNGTYTSIAVSDTILNLTPKDVALAHSYDIAFKRTTNFNGLISGHKYYLYIDLKFSDAGHMFNLWLGNNSRYYGGYGTTVPANEWVSWNEIFTATNTSTSSQKYILGTINCNAGSNYNGQVYQFKKFNLIDLTDWYGAGKEPSTVQEFKEQFTKEYYGFCPTPIKLTRYQIEALPNYGYNQLIENGDFSNGVNKWHRNSTYTSLTNEDGIGVLTITSSGATTTQINLYTSNNNLQAVVGHKYFSSYTIRSNVNTAYEDQSFGGTRDYVSTTVNNVNQNWSTRERILTATNTNGWQIYLAGNYTVGNKYYFKNIMIIDLTDCYGEGNEPTTTAEFKATFPNLYYPYSKKRLLNKYMINKLIN